MASLLYRAVFRFLRRAALAVRFGKRFFFSPMNFNFHGAHHFYPWIPHHNLPALQAYLAARGVGIVERPSYVGLIGRLLSGPLRAAA